MRHTSWTYLTAAALVALFGVEVYRAATASITVDEARVWEDFIAPHPSVLLSSYDAAYHVLQTWMSYIAVQCFGDSELAMRLPALIACAAYLAFAYRFAVRRFGESMTMFTAALFLATNPLILDHLALARGYGVALALFAWSLYFSLCFVESGSRRALTASGVLSGLAIAANLTFAPVVTGLAAATVILSRRTGRKPDWINDYAGPGAVIAALVLVLPLAHMDVKEHFYFGASTIRGALADTAGSIFDRPWGHAAAAVVTIGGALLVGAGLISERRNLAARMCGIGLLIALAVTLVIPWAFGTPYPMGRTILGLIFFFMLTAMTCAGSVGSRAAMLLCATATLVQLSELDPRYFSEWRFTARTKQWFETISARERSAAREFRVTGNWEYAFPAKYYRTRLRLTHMQLSDGPTAVTGADYYLIFGQRRANEASDFGARILADDETCGCLLAAR